MRRRRRLTMTAAISGALILGVSPSAAPTPGLSPAALLIYTVGATKAQVSAHFAATSTDGHQSTTLVADVSSLGLGQQTVTVRKGSSVGHVTGRYVGGDVYFNGNAFGLRTYLGMPSALANAYAGKWLIFTPADSGYSAIAREFMLSTTAINEIAIAGPLSYTRPTSVRGTPVIGVRGMWHSLSVAGKQGPATLYVRTSSSHLPVLLTVQDSGANPTSRGQVTFSRWGETFKVGVPEGAVSYATIATRPLTP